MNPTPVALLAALAISSPAIWGALVTGTVSLDSAIVRTVVAVVVASMVARFVGLLVASYGTAGRIPKPVPGAVEGSGRPAAVTTAPGLRRRDDDAPDGSRNDRRRGARP